MANLTFYTTSSPPPITAASPHQTASVLRIAGYQSAGKYPNAWLKSAFVLKLIMIFKENMTCVTPSLSISCEQPFLVLYNYRKTKQLRKARELRKARLERLRLEQKMQLQESRRERQEAINRNMFEDDCKWDLCYENYRADKEMCEDDNSTLQQEPASRSLAQMRMEAVSLVPAVAKQMLFAVGFQPFSFEAAL